MDEMLLFRILMTLGLTLAWLLILVGLTLAGSFSGSILASTAGFFIGSAFVNALFYFLLDR